MQPPFESIPLRLNTGDIPKDRRVETWREVMWGLCSPMTCETSGAADFRSRVVAAEIGPVGLRHIWCDPYRGRQTAATLARSKRDVYVLTSTTGGSFEMAQYGRHVRLDGGIVSMHSTMDALESVHTIPSSAFIVIIPAHNLKQRLPIPEDYCLRAIPRHGAATSIFFECLEATVRHYGRLAPAEHEMLSERLIDLLVMMLESELGRPRVAVGGVRASHLRRAKAYADSNLHRPDLTPKAIADELGFSSRYLHLLFRNEPQTIGAWLRERRLEKARQALADPRFSVLSISEVAYRHGFRSNTHFTTCFKAAFGTTPKRMRNRRRPDEGDT